MIESNGAKYYPTIGLEIHAELATETKMFCHCKNDADETRPNVNTCPVCMAHPGILPVPNYKAIESMVKIGLAVGGKIANFSEFDRKNYFYPDIPKGYQISQYKYPIVSGGELAGVKLTRIHLEEDTANNKHEGNYSLVDFNRAGMPLMELVTEPVIHDAETAMKFGKELQLLLRTLGVAHANMEKGEMRVEVNVSISTDPNVFGTKVEVKNINSFSAAGKSIQYEINRMIGLHEAGRADEIVQETRGWDDTKQATYSQRKKENSHDYRYFPDPDIPKFYLYDLFDRKKMKSELPELPWQKRERYANDYGIKAEDIETYVADADLAKWFEDVASKLVDKEKIIKASNYVTSDLLGHLNSDNKVIKTSRPSSENFADLINLVHRNEINSRIAKDLLASMVREDRSPSMLMISLGLQQQNDEGALREMVQKVLAANPDKVAEYKSGKEALLMFFVGQIMKETKGSANPATLQKILKESMQ